MEIIRDIPGVNNYTLHYDGNVYAARHNNIVIKDYPSADGRVIYINNKPVLLACIVQQVFNVKTARQRLDDVLFNNKQVASKTPKRRGLDQDSIEYVIANPKGLTQTELASMFNVSRQYISKLLKQQGA